MVPEITNTDARRLWLDAQGLSRSPTGPLCLKTLIHKLGFVQIDTIRNVTRAHHHIIWSRNQNYREPMLWSHLADERAVFEHFTHDASLIPMEFYPMWQRQFRRLGEKIESYGYFKSISRAGCDAIKARIENEGPLSTRAFQTAKPRSKDMWARPEHKKALDYMWYKGELSTSHRENFIKFYDLSGRVIPPGLRAVEYSDREQIDWLCQAALSRLSIGTPGEIQRFWAAASAAEVKDWAARNDTGLVPVRVQSAKGLWTNAFAPPDIEVRLSRTPKPTRRLRIINPFDPVVRDRNRLERLFGFEYKNEMFVPKAKRKWGYYVYPLLEGDRFIGRMEIKADRKAGTLDVMQFWPEPGVKWTPGRYDKLSAELARLARFIDVEAVIWHCPRS